MGVDFVNTLTRYARALAERIGGVVLSLDELMLSVLPRELGAEHDEYAARAKEYLYARAVEMARAGVSPVLDFGFWSAGERKSVSERFEREGLRVSWHYVDAPDKDWRRNIDERNARVNAGEKGAYPVDAGLLAKLEARFEPPKRGEMDVWYVNRRDD